MPTQLTEQQKSRAKVIMKVFDAHQKELSALRQATADTLRQQEQAKQEAYTPVPQAELYSAQEEGKIYPVQKREPYAVPFSLGKDYTQTRSVVGNDGRYYKIPNVSHTYTEAEAVEVAEQLAEKYKNMQAEGQQLDAYQRSIITAFPKTQIKERLPILDSIPFGMHLYMPIQGFIKMVGNIAGNTTDIILEATASKAEKEYRNNPGVQLLKKLEKTNPDKAAQIKALLPQFDPINTDTIYLDPNADYQKLFDSVEANPKSRLTGNVLPNAWYGIKPTPKEEKSDSNVFFFNRDFWESFRDSARELTTPGERQVFGYDLIHEPKNLTEALLEVGGQVIYPAGKVFGALSKVIKGTGPGATIARGAVGGFAVDGLVFEPGNSVINMLEDAGIESQFFDWLKSDPTDTKTEMIFKQALEGVVLGGSIEAVMAGLRSWRAANITYRAERDEVLREAIMANIDEKTIGKLKKGTGNINDPKVMNRMEKESLQESHGIWDTIEQQEALLERAGKISSETLRAKVIRDITQSSSVESAILRMRENYARSLGRKASDVSDQELLAKYATANKRTVTAELVDSIHAGTLDMSIIESTMARYGLSADELADELLKTVSKAGKTLAYMSALSRRLNKMFPKMSDEARGKLAHIERMNKESLWTRSWRTLEDTRRGLLLFQLATATRNMASATGRMGISMAFDENLQSLIRGTIKATSQGGRGQFWKSFSDEFKGNLSMFHAISSTLKSEIKYLRKKKGKDWVPSLDTRRQDENTMNELMNLIGAGGKLPKNFSKAQHIIRAISPSIHEATLGSKIANISNWVNRPQEIVMRRLAFEYKARQLAARKGVDINDLDVSDIKDVADYSLEMTFAANAKTEGMRNFLSTWRNSPLSVINPFPRFMFANALPFMWEHSPLGFIDLLTKTDLPVGGLRAISRNPDEFAKIMSRAVFGTTAMWAAWSYRDSPYAGNKWYLLNTPHGQLDVRVFSPLASSFLFSDIAQKYLRGTIDWTDAKELAKEGTGLSRPSGTALPVAKMFMSKEFSEQYLQAFVGQYLASFSTPLRMANDFGASKIINPIFEGSPFTDSSHIMRDIRSDPMHSTLYGPEYMETVRNHPDALYATSFDAYTKAFIANFPGLQTLLPAATTPFVGKEDVTQQELEDPNFEFKQMRTSHSLMQSLARQFTGISFKPIGRFEQEFQRLKIQPSKIFSSSGSKTLDRVINGYTGQIIHMAVTPYLNTKGYLNAPIENQRVWLENAIAAAKKSAKRLAGTRLPAELTMSEESQEYNESQEKLLKTNNQTRP